MESKPISARKNRKNTHLKKSNHPYMTRIVRFINVPEPFRTVLLVGGVLLLLSATLYRVNSTTHLEPEREQSVNLQPDHPVQRQVALTDYRGNQVLTFTTSGTVDPFAQQAIPISYSYYDTGYRRTMIDASGTTQYTYDARDRLLTKKTPQGMQQFFVWKTKAKKDKLKG
ncbi:MAG: RHS repeat protein [Acidobacteria bacterium]|nr:RHS repeat protein [Acidobacteriota bacterium]